MIKKTIRSLAVLALVAASSMATADTRSFVYTGEVTGGTGAMIALTTGGSVFGQIFYDAAAVDSGLVIPADIIDMTVDIGGFCFTTVEPPLSACGGSSPSPIQSIDTAAITFGLDGLPTGGQLGITATNLSFGVPIAVAFDLTAGTFLATSAVLGTLLGTIVWDGSPPTITNADLELGVSNNAMQPVDAFDEYEYLFDLVNSGFAVATNSRVDVSLSNNLEFVDSGTNCASDNGDNTVTWLAGDLNSGESAQCSFLVRIVNLGDAVVTATATAIATTTTGSDLIDPTPANNVNIGNVVSVVVYEVPTLGAWAMTLMAMLLAIFGFRSRSFRNHHCN